MRKRITGWAVVTAILLPAAALAGGIVYEGQSELTANPMLYRGRVLTGGDSRSWTGPLDAIGRDASIQPTKGNPCLRLSPSSSVAGAAYELQIGLFNKTTVAGVASYNPLGVCYVCSFTAGYSQLDPEGYFLGNEVIRVPVDGATHYEVRIPETISTGNIRILAWVGTADTQGPTATPHR